MIKLIVSDMGGTLVSDGSPDLDSEIFDIILRLREKGMRFVAVSGRPWISMGDALEPVGKKISYIASNGAHVGCRGRCLYAHTMDHQLAHRITRKACMYSELKMVYAGVNEDYPDSENDALYDWLTNGYKFSVIRVRDALKLGGPCVKISIYKKEEIEAVTRDIYEEFRGQAKMTCADDIQIDCMTRDMNKGRVVCTVQKSLGTKAGETVVFGDQLNDIEMLNQAYYSFAAASTREEVRRATRFQTDNNVRGGAFKTLKGLL